jgi:cysteine desulfuration protein SufE
MNIELTQKEIINEFEMFDTWMDKYEYIIELGKELPLINIEFKKEENLIKGCQSRVWLHAELSNNKIYYFADSDAIITKGIIALLIRVLNNHNAEDIYNTKLDFINQIGLTNHLSPTRANGLLEMVKQMKTYAYAYIVKNNLSKNN